MTRRPWCWMASLSALAACAVPAPAADPGGDPSLELEHLVRQRKAATAMGDSTAWLRAASVHSRATCADARGGLRVCRPDLASPSSWQLGTAVDSVQVNTVDSIAIVTYRQTDTVHVGVETVQSAFRYVETYRRRAGRWELLALAEIPVPPARVPVPGNVAAYPGYVGTYASGTYALTGALQGDYLLVGASGERPDTLLALTDTTFFVPGDPGEYLFALGGGTTAAELLYRTNGQALRFRRRGG